MSNNGISTYTGILYVEDCERTYINMSGTIIYVVERAPYRRVQDGHVIPAMVLTVIREIM